METISTHYPIADFCQSLQDGAIQVNTDYQRSDKVWPPAARSFLIETIILGYPVPKISLHQRLDLKSRKSLKEIVDGQQRSKAIRDFFEGRLRLSRSLETSEIKGRVFDELADDMQERFLNYSLAADIFVNATPETIREVFRRTNSYTVPLNPEEERHATFQGLFKWFIYRLSRANDEILAEAGVFREKGFVRMADTKLYSEVIHALLYGISTTNKTKLTEHYRSHESEFPQEEEFEGRFRDTLSLLREWSEIHGTALMKPLMAYSLILAIMHLQDPVPSLQEVYELSRPHPISKTTAVNQLLDLAQAFDTYQELEDDERERFPFGEFCKAASEGTNVRDQRETRFQWFCRALRGEIGA